MAHMLGDGHYFANTAPTPSLHFPFHVIKRLDRCKFRSAPHMQLQPSRDLTLDPSPQVEMGPCPRNFKSRQPAASCPPSQGMAWKAAKVEHMRGPHGMLLKVVTS